MKPENYKKRLITKSISELKKIADELTSLVVRQKYANWKNEVKCYTCDKWLPIKSIQCGHYISRVYSNTRWYEPNLRPQCYSCNIMKKGNMDEFAIRLEREKPGILEELNEWKHRNSSPNTRQDLLVLIEDLKNKVLQ